MPIGKVHVEEGRLLREQDWVILQRDDGGRWRLDVDARCEELLGLRVRVEGVRSDFDLLQVSRMVRC
jgi:hypothetical protein